MQVLGSYISRGVYTVSAPFHPFGGAVDIIAVEQQDGSLKSSPWYVRFGKFQGVLKSKEKIVNIVVNEIDAGFHMYLDKKGEAYFLKESYSNEEDEFVFSPPTSGDETDGSNKSGNINRELSLDNETDQMELASKSGVKNGKFLARRNVQHSKVMGFFTGKKPTKNQVSCRDMPRLCSLECAEMVAHLLETSWSADISTSGQRCKNFNTMPINVSNNPEDEFDRSNGNKCAMEESDEISTCNDCVDQGEVSSIICYETFEGSTVTFDNAVDRSVELPSDIIEQTELIKEVVYETSTQCSYSGGRVFQRSFANANRVRTEPDYDFSSLNAQLQSSEYTSESVKEDGEKEIQIWQGVEGAKHLLQLSPESAPSNYQRDNCASDEILMEANLPLDAEIVAEEKSSSDINTELSFNDLPDMSKVHSYPISIPKCEANLEESNHLLRSLPNFHSHIHYLEGSDHFDTSTHSLPLNSRILEQGVFDKGSVGKVIQTDPSKESIAENIILNCITQQIGVTSNPVVELSLCKHLLFEGIGAEAASQVFEAEKVDTQKYAVLGPAIVKNDKLIIRIHGHYFPWDAAAPIILEMTSSSPDHIFDTKGMIEVSDDERVSNQLQSRAIVSSKGGSWNLWPFGSTKAKSMSAENLLLNKNKKDVESALVGSVSSVSDMPKRRNTKKYVKTLTPSSPQLASLNLKEGKNFVTFNFETGMLGRQQVDARIYLWKQNSRIVVSDVDGTITKSDVLGQFMPLVGKDWSQNGVAHLFSSIKDNGYQFLYLSARAVSQASLTRQFLFTLVQDGKALPDGPVVISPDGLFPSLYREVIRRTPHEFKISCLEDIKVLFPPDSNPFYAGFGNRPTDEISYLKVGIPKGKIFTVNPKGEVVVNQRVNTKSYSSLHALVNGMFPLTSSEEQEDFNSWNFWRVPVPDIDI